MMTREEYRDTKEARQLLRNLIADNLAPLIAELDAASSRLQKVHGEYIKGLALFTGKPGSAEHQAHLRTMEVCRDLIEAEAPLRNTRQTIEMAVHSGETIEWSERLGPIYTVIARAEATLAHVDGAIRKTGKAVATPAFMSAQYGERFRAITKATLKPDASCSQAQIDLLAECIGL